MRQPDHSAPQHSGIGILVAGGDGTRGFSAPRDAAPPTNACGVRAPRTVPPEPQVAGAATGRVCRLLGRMVRPACGAALVLLVAAGWHWRDHTTITPESRIGYALGIVGSALMLSLLAYSARKRLPWLQGRGRLGRWFQVHMALGLVAPVVILFHANFRLGSTNSNVAVGSMLVVMASGIVGRFIYARITHSLYGSRATLRELHEELVANRRGLEKDMRPDSSMNRRLAAFEAHAHHPGTGWGRRLVWLLGLPLHARGLRAAMLRDIALHEADPSMRRARQREATTRIAAYVAAVLKDAHFSVYERLFSLWHALHLPLFFLLVVAVVVHVVAVHMY